MRSGAGEVTTKKSASTRPPSDAAARAVIETRNKTTTTGRSLPLELKLKQGTLDLKKF